MVTLLPRKSESAFPMASNDVALAQLYEDPAIPQFDAASPFPENRSPSYSSPTYAGVPNQWTGPAPSQPVLTASNGDVDITPVSADKQTEHWLNSRWRPAMGWTYMAICITDFVVFPVLWSGLQAMFHGVVTAQWQPLTLQGAGLFHMAMGTILGIAAYGRTKEKVDGIR